MAPLTHIHTIINRLPLLRVHLHNSVHMHNNLFIRQEGIHRNIPLGTNLDLLLIVLVLNNLESTARLINLHPEARVHQVALVIA